MKQTTLLLLLAASILINSSCKKEGSSKTTTPTTPTILIVTLPDSVKIGTQWWTSVNYNGQGGVNYANSSINNPSWGKLYTNKEIALMVIPKGWRIPTTADFNTLMQYVGGISKDPKTGNNMLGPGEANALMSKTEWINNIGTNSTGFNAVPAGFESNDNLFSEAAQPGAKFVEAGFATSSVYTGDRGGIANFAIYQSAYDTPILTSGVITSFSPIGGGNGEARSSVRFVRNN